MFFAPTLEEVCGETSKTNFVVFSGRRLVTFWVHFLGPLCWAALIIDRPCFWGGPCYLPCYCFCCCCCCCCMFLKTLMSPWDTSL